MVTEGVGLWGRLATCGGLVTRLPTLAKRAVQRRLATGAEDTSAQSFRRVSLYFASLNR
jgi:hypothetical protein